MWSLCALLWPLLVTLMATAAVTPATAQSQSQSQSQSLLPLSLSPSPSVEASLQRLWAAHETVSVSVTPGDAPGLGGLRLLLRVNATALDPAAALSDPTEAAGFFFASNTQNRISALEFQPGTRTPQSFQFRAGVCAGTALLFFEWAEAQPGIEYDSARFALPDPIAIAVDSLGAFDIPAPLEIYHGHTVRLPVRPAFIINGVTLAITTSVGQIVLAGADGGPTAPGATPTQLSLTWTADNARKDTWLRAPTLAAAGAATAMTLSFVSTGLDSTILRQPPSVTVTLLSTGGWLIGAPPTQLALGQTWTLSVAPESLDALATAEAVIIQMTVNTGSVQPTAGLSFSSAVNGSQAQQFQVSAPWTAGLVDVAFSVSTIGTGSSTTLRAPSPCQLVVQSTLSLTTTASMSAVPTSFYSNQLSESLSLRPMLAGIIDAQKRLLVTFVSNTSWTAVPTVTGSEPLPVPGVFVAQPSSIGFVTTNSLSLQLRAPEVPMGYSLGARISMIVSDRAALHFAPPPPLDIVVLAQSPLLIEPVAGQGSRTSVLAHQSLSWTVRQSVPADFDGFTLRVALQPPGAGTLSASSLIFPASILHSVTLTLTASLAVQPDLRVVFTTEGGDGAHFLPPAPISVATLGPLLLPGCSASTPNVIVSGANDVGGSGGGIGSLLFNGLYVVGAPINGQAHYVLSPQGGGPPGQTVHLFYRLASSPSPSGGVAPPPAYTPPAGSGFGSTMQAGTWILDSSTSDLTAQALWLAAASPLQAGARWSAVASGSAVQPGVMVSCGVDCAKLGNDTIDTHMCFNGVALAALAVPPPTPTVCPISCGHYLPAIVASCSTAPSTISAWQPSMSVPLTAMAARCANCSYSRTVSVMRACAITTVDGDNGWEMANAMRFPDTCSLACLDLWPSFYAACVSDAPALQPRPWSPIEQFNAVCLSAAALAQPTNQTLIGPIDALHFTNVQHDSVIAWWDAPFQPAASALPLLYTLEHSASATFSGATSITTMDPSALLTPLGVGASSVLFVRVRAAPTSDAGAAVAAITTPWTTANVTTGVDPLAAPTSFSFATPLYTPPSPGVNGTFQTLVTWQALAPVGNASSPPVYRVQLQSGTVDRDGVYVWQPPVQVYVGSDTSFQLVGMLPSVIPTGRHKPVFQLLLSAAMAPDSDGRGGSSHRLTAVATGILPLDPIAPEVPLFTAPVTQDLNVTTGVALEWSRDFFCAFGASGCSPQPVYQIATVSAPFSAFNAANIAAIAWRGGGSDSTQAMPATTIGALFGGLVDTDWTVSDAPTAPYTFLPAAGSVDTVFAFRVRTTSKSSAAGHVAHISPWSAAMMVAMPPSPPSIDPSLTDLRIDQVTYLSARARWTPSLAVRTSALAAPDEWHFRLRPTATASGILLSALPLIDFYVSVSDLPLDESGLATVWFDSSHSANGVGMHNGTLYEVLWEVHASVGAGTGDGVATSRTATGAGWSGLQPVLNNAAGGGGSPLVLSVPIAPPTLLSLTTRDFGKQRREFRAGSSLIFTFDRSTNQPISAWITPNTLNIFGCDPPDALVGHTFTGSWTAASSTFTVEFQDVSPATASRIAVGAFQCWIKQSPEPGAGAQLRAPEPAANSGFIASGASYEMVKDPSLLRATLMGALFEMQLKLLLPSVTAQPVAQDSADTKLDVRLRENILPADGIDNHLFVSVRVSVLDGATLSYPLGAPPSQRRTTVTVDGFTYSQLVDSSVSPLQRIGVTPTANFVGQLVVSLSLTNVAGNRTGVVVPVQPSIAVEQVTLLLSVYKINHAPQIRSSYATLTAPFDVPGVHSAEAPLRIDALLSPSDISDPDDPAGALPVRLLLSAGPSLSARFTLTQLPLGVACSSAVGAAAPLLRLYGPLSAVAAALQLVTFFESGAATGAGIDWPAPDTLIQMHVDDLGSGMAARAPGGAPLQASANFFLRFTGTARSASPPAVRSVRFSVDFVELLVELDGPVRALGDWQDSVGGMVSGGTIPQDSWRPVQSPAYSCGQIFAAPTVAMLGTGARCFFAPANVLRVGIGHASTVAPGSLLTFGAGADGTLSLGRSASAVAPSGVLSGSYAVLLSNASALVMPPLFVSLSGASNLSLCDDLFVRAHVVNSSLHAGLRFRWSMQPSVLPDVLDDSADVLHVDAALLRVGVVYTVRVQLFNAWTTQHSPVARMEVVKSQMALPSVAVAGPTVRAISRGDPLRVDLIADVSDCLTTLTHAQQHLSFEWTISPAPAVSVADLLTSRTLLLPPDTLLFGFTYTLTARVRMVAQPSLVSSVVLTIRVLAAPLTVVVEGGAMQTQSSSVPLTLQAHAWDSDATDKPFSWGWSCELVLQADQSAPLPLHIATACYDRHAHASLTPESLAPMATVAVNGAAQSSASLILPADTLRPGTYLLTAVASKENRVAVRKSVTVVVAAAANAPTVTISPGSVFLNPSDALLLSATAQVPPHATAASTTASSFSYLWSVSPLPFASALLPFFTDPALTRGWTSPSLAINAGTGALAGRSRRGLDVFPAGAYFRLRCTVVDLSTGATGWAEAEVNVARAPTGGLFSVTPAVGFSGATEFVLSAEGFSSVQGPGQVAATNPGLVYRFFVQQDDGSLVGVGRQPGAAIDSDVLFLPTGGVGAAQSRTVTLVCRVQSGAGGVFSMHTTSVLLQPHPSLGGAPLASLQWSALALRLANGNRTLNVAGAFNAYLRVAAQDTLATVSAPDLAGAPMAYPAGAWPRTLGGRSMQTRCNVAQHPALAALPPLLGNASTAINTLTPGGVVVPLQGRAQLHVSFFAEFNRLMSAQPLLQAHLALAVRTCASMTLAAQILPYSYTWSSNQQLARLSSHCTAALVALVAPTPTVVAASNGGGRTGLSLALSSEGCSGSQAAWGLAHGSFRTVCFHEKRALLHDAMLALLGLWQLQRLQLAPGATLAQSFVEGSFVPLLHSLLDLQRHYLLTAAALPSRFEAATDGSKTDAPRLSTLVYYPDCQVSSLVSRNDLTQRALLSFPAINDASSATLLAAPRPASEPQLSASALLVDTRLVLFTSNPFVWGTVPQSFPLVSGVMGVGRSTAQGATVDASVGGGIMLSLSLTAPNCNPVCAACNNTACVLCDLSCLPTCVLWDASAQTWRRDPAMTSGVRYGATADSRTLVADCTLAPSLLASPTATVFVTVLAATPAFSDIVWPPVAGSSSTGAADASSTGAAQVSPSSSSSSGADGGGGGDGGVASSTGPADGGGSGSGSSTGIDRSNSSTGGGSGYVPPATADGVRSSLQLRIPYQTVVSQLVEFATQLVRDLSVASGVATSRIAVDGVAPDGDVVRYNVTVENAPSATARASANNAAIARASTRSSRRTALIPLPSVLSKAAENTTADNSTSPTPETPAQPAPTVVTLVNSTLLLVSLQVTPSSDQFAVSPASFSANLSAQIEARAGPIYDGVYSRHVVSATFSTFAMQLCSDNLYRVDCGAGQPPPPAPAPSSSSGSARLLGFPLAIGIAIIAGGAVGLGLLVLIAYCVHKTRNVEKDFKKTPREERERKRKLLLEKRAAAARAVAAAQAAKDKLKPRSGRFRSGAPVPGEEETASPQSPSQRGSPFAGGSTSAFAASAQSDYPAPPSSRRKDKGQGRGTGAAVRSPAIELPEIEPTWEAAMFVPSHLRKMAAVVTARTAGHEATDAHEQQPVASAANAHAHAHAGHHDGDADQPGLSPHGRASEQQEQAALQAQTASRAQVLQAAPRAAEPVRLRRAMPLPASPGSAMGGSVAGGRGAGGVPVRSAVGPGSFPIRPLDQQLQAHAPLRGPLASAAPGTVGAGAVRVHTGVGVGVGVGQQSLPRRAPGRPGPKAGPGPGARVRLTPQQMAAQVQGGFF